MPRAASSSPPTNRPTARFSILSRPAESAWLPDEAGPATIRPSSSPAVLGGNAPAHVVVNEFTTVASVWTAAQFLDGTMIKGHALGLHIAAGNVPNFVDLATGGWGEAIQDPLNGGQTPKRWPTSPTLADRLAGCATRVVDDALRRSCSPRRRRPKAARKTDTLTAAKAIAHYPGIPSRAPVRLTRRVLSSPAGQDERTANAAEHAAGAVHALPHLVAQRLGATVEIRRRRLSGRRQGHVKQTRATCGVGDNFTIGWRGAGCAVARATPPRLPRTASRCRQSTTRFTMAAGWRAAPPALTV